MMSRSWLGYLFPKEEGAFLEEVRRLSVAGLRVIAGVCIGAPIFMLAVSSLVPEVRQYLALETAFGIVLLGVAALALSRWRPAQPHARAAGMAVGYLVFLVQTVTPAENPALLSHIAAANVAVVMVVGIAAVPIRPIQILALGMAMNLTHVLFIRFGVDPSAVTQEVRVSPAVILQIVLICTALTVVVYRQRFAAFQARRSAQEALDELKKAQARLVVAENAASQGRFAAALSHELGSPLGSMASAVETIQLVFERGKADPGAWRRLEEVFLGAARSLRDAVERLTRIRDRMKQLTNLDRAEEQVVDLGELWTQTVALLQAELAPRADVVLDIGPLSPVKSRPQQLGTVFANLLRNAAAAIEGKGRIEIVGAEREGEIVVEVRDNGRGIPRERLRGLFDPTFRVEGSRVSTTNWGLFVSRSIVAEHGGRLEIESTEGVGTIARISLPASAGDRVRAAG